ncbi:MAG TPA: hypothetical protein VFT72_14870 [Opitutaceae bacterium]|nr:hypothetical protein [Opitutaceae bacterium]
MNESSATLHCDIVAPSLGAARVLGKIARACAKDVGVKLQVHAEADLKSSAQKILTLEMSAEMAASQNPAWCLACRLACFCPDTRVSVLVRSEDSFSSTSTKVRRHSAA